MRLFWLFLPCCASVGIPATVLPCAGVVFTTLVVGWFSAMVGAMVSKRREGVRGSLGESERREFWRRAIAVDGRKEWIGKFCSESSVWTRWRCRRCYHNIPAGLRGKLQAGGRSKEWGRVNGLFDMSGEEDKKDAEIKGLRGPKLSIIGSRLEEKSKDGKAFHPEEKVDWRRCGDWRLKMRSRAERSWMSNGKSCRRSCETLRNLSCASKEVQDSLKNDLQQQLQEVEQRRHDLMPEHQKVQKRSQKIPSIEDKRRTFQKESTAAQEEMRKIRKEIDRNEERFRQLSDKFD